MKILPVQAMLSHRNPHPFDSITLPLCRVCLQQCSEQYSSLFDSIEDTPIYEHISSLVDIKISKNDGYPQAICHCCLQDLQVVISFRQRCINTNISLRYSTVKHSPVKKEEIELDDHEPNYEETEEPSSELQISIDTSKLQLFNTDYKVKSRESVFECHDCGEVFRTKCKLRVHWKKTHLPYAYVCHLCKRIFKNALAYHKHLKLIKKKVCVNLQQVIVEGEGKERQFVCRMCNYSCKSRLYMETHGKIHSDLKMYACDLCDQSFKQKAALYNHRKYTHKLCTDAFTCHICGKQLVGKPNLGKHMRRKHKDKVQCDICKKEYRTKCTLIQHLKRHAGSKTYNCKSCIKSFYTLSEVIGHTNKVHSKKLYECRFCKYKSRNGVKKHEMRHTVARWNIPCETCGKFFESKAKLQKHVEIHNSEKKFSCPICDRKFHRKKSMQSHITGKHKKLKITD